MEMLFRTPKLAIFQIEDPERELPPRLFGIVLPALILLLSEPLNVYTERDVYAEHDNEGHQESMWHAVQPFR